MVIKRKDKLAPGWSNLILRLKIIILGSIIACVAAFILSFLNNTIAILIASTTVSIIMGFFIIKHVITNLKNINFGFKLRKKSLFFAKFYLIINFIFFPLLFLNSFSTIKYIISSNASINVALSLLILTTFILPIIVAIIITLLLNKDMDKLYQE